MLSKDQLEVYEEFLMKELTKRRSLGGYSPDANFLQFLAEFSYELVRHLRETRRKKKDDPET